jgi:hypothetical protein
VARLGLADQTEGNETRKPAVIGCQISHVLERLSLSIHVIL